jgi:uncharacterized protein YodC (DUF2158 family)
MKKRKDGGPAFAFSMHPEHGYGPSESVNEGMSLREWFAGMAVQGIIYNEGYLNPNSLAREAFAVADAMIAESEKENT